MIVTALFAHEAEVFRIENDIIEYAFFVISVTFVTQDPNKLAIITLNRHQNRLDMYFGDPRSTVCKQVLRDESDAYIKEGVFDNIIFYPENFSLLGSCVKRIRGMYPSASKGTCILRVTFDLISKVCTLTFEFASPVLGYL